MLARLIRVIEMHLGVQWWVVVSRDGPQFCVRVEYRGTVIRARAGTLEHAEGRAAERVEQAAMDMRPRRPGGSSDGLAVLLDASLEKARQDLRARELGAAATARPANDDGDE